MEWKKKSPAFNRVMFLVFTVTVAFAGILIGGAATVLASTTFPSSDSDISETETAYADLEAALNVQINDMENAHPGYDEYIPGG